MLISPFTPVFFPPQKCDGTDGEYIQTFYITDSILLEIICSSDEPEPAATIEYLDTDESEPIMWNSWAINETTTLFFTDISLGEGAYQINIQDFGASAPFRFTKDKTILDRTTLIQYTNSTNRHRTDSVFVIDGMRRFFSFRAPGGFKDKGWAFGVESEQFTTPSGDVIQLYAQESTLKTFTMGNSMGCPIWFGELLNRALCCEYVYFDGERYNRKDTSVPEIEPVMDNVNSFIFTQQLQKSVNLDPHIEHANALLLRTLPDSTFRILSETFQLRKI